MSLARLSLPVRSYSSSIPIDPGDIEKGFSKLYYLPLTEKTNIGAFESTVCVIDADFRRLRALVALLAADLLWGRENETGEGGGDASMEHTEVSLVSLCKNLREKSGPAFSRWSYLARWIGLSRSQTGSTPIQTSQRRTDRQAGKQVHSTAIAVLISPHSTTSYLSQSRWLTKGNQNIKEEGLKGNVSNVTPDARRLCPEFIYLLLCCCSRTNRLLLSPTSSRLSNPLWQDSWPRWWGKADLDVGPIPDNQIRTSAALLTAFCFQ